VTVPDAGDAELRIAVAGRLGASLLTAMSGFDAEVLPRHHVLVVTAGDVEELIGVLRHLEERGLEVDSVTAFESSRAGRADPAVAEGRGGGSGPAGEAAVLIPGG
jgi:hypothetical protein